MRDKKSRLSGFLTSLGSLLLVFTLSVTSGAPVPFSAPDTKISVSQEQEKKEEERRERQRLGYLYSEIVDLTPEKAVSSSPPQPTPAEKAMRVYLEAGGSGMDRVPANVMTDMYKAAGGGEKAFKTVAHLIDKGLDPSQVVDKAYFNKNKPEDLKISNDHSIGMAEQRDAWIDDIIKEVGKEKGWEIARSDSGNMSSGMKSDLDQTFFVFEVDENGEKSPKRNADLDKAFVDEFNRKWQEKHPNISVDALDIASFEGKSRFPDPRERMFNFADDFRRTSMNLRRARGAYTFDGAVRHQMQLRALDAVEQSNERAYQLYGPDENGDWDKKPHEPGDPVRHMFGVSPELMPGHSFGAAMGNFMMILHYMDPKQKFESKYHLRTAEDCLIPLLMKEKNWHDKVEYTDFDETSRKAFNEVLINRVFQDPQKQRLHQMAMDISVDLRLLHKNKPEKIPRYKNGVPGDPSKRNDGLFHDLAREMYGADFNPDNPDAKHIEGAVKKHRQLAAEFCLESVLHSSIEAFKVYQDARYKRPFDFDQYKHLMSGMGKASWPQTRENLKEAAQISFLYSIYDLGIANSARLIWRLNQQLGPGEYGARLDLLSMWMRGQVQGLEEIYRDPARAYDEYSKVFANMAEKVDLYARTRAADLSLKVQGHVLAELGIEKIKSAEYVNSRLGKFKLTWNPGKLASKLTWDPGNVDALAQIIRVYVESKGDLDRTMSAIVNEVIMAIPIGGQIYSATQGGLTGLVFMAGAIQFPAVGIALMAYSVGEAGYAIYDLEYRQHNVANVENAIYRGFVGPATRAFDSSPQQFTRKDQLDLSSWKDYLAALKEKAGRSPSRAEQLKKEIDDISKKVYVLEQKKSAWEKFRDDSAYGGYFSEWGAQTEQKLLTPSLMDDIPPIISFSPAGIVDFRARYKPEENEASWNQLQVQIAGAQDSELLLKLTAEFQELDLQKSRYERAQRYLKKALGQSRSNTFMTELEAKAGSPELLHKIKRDSLYPALRDMAVAAKDRSVQPNTDRFVDAWLVKNKDRCIHRLVVLGVLKEFVTDADISAEVIEKLKNRMEKDYQRSRALFLEFEKQEQRRKQQEVIKQKQRQRAYHAQAAGMLVEGMDKDPDLKGMNELNTAMRYAAIKRNPPRIKSTVYMIRNKDELVKEGTVNPQPATASPGKKPKEDTYDFRVSVQVTADPHLYRPPYHTKILTLDKATARQAVKSGKIEDQVLLPDTIKALQIVLNERLARSSKEDTIIPLISVYADSMADLSRAIPQTVAHLPGVNRSQISVQGTPDQPGTTPDPAAATENRNGSPLLMGQSIAYGTLTSVTGDLSISTRRDLQNFGTEIIVTSKTLAQLDETSGKSLEYLLYAAKSPDDEFALVKRSRLFKPGMEIKRDVIKGDSNEDFNERMSPRRIAVDKMIFHERYGYKAVASLAKKKKIEDKPGPLYYMVGERWVMSGSKTRGKESFSPVSEQSASLLYFEPRKSDIIDESTFTVITGGFARMPRMHFGLRDQLYNYQKVKYTVNSGSWTGYYWQAPQVSIRGGRAGVTIKAEAEGYSDVRSIELVEKSDPQSIAAAAKREESFQKSLTQKTEYYDRDIKQVKKDISELSEKITNAEKRLNEEQEKYNKSPSYSQAKKVSDARGRVASAKRDRIRLPQVRLVRIEANYGIYVAFPRKDWEKEIQDRLQLLTALETEHKLIKQGVAESVKESNWQLGQSGISQDNREDLSKSIEYYQNEWPTMRRIQYLNDRNKLLGPLVSLAMLTANVQLLHQTRQGQIEIGEELIRIAETQTDKDLGSGWSNSYKSYARELVTLTSDTEAAAALWIKGHNIGLARNKRSPEMVKLYGKPKPWYELDSLPPWWPEGKRKKGSFDK